MYASDKRTNLYTKYMDREWKKEQKVNFFGAGARIVWC